MLRKSICAAAFAAIVFGSTSSAIACTMQQPSLPEVEIEIEFEDYDGFRDRVYYKIQIEIEVFPPTQTTQCQCGVGIGSANFVMPDSFAVVAAAVAIKNDEMDQDFELDAFAGFSDDESVTAALSNLSGFNFGAASFGLSATVDPFSLPPLGPEDRLVLGFIIEFAPADFAAVNGKPIQFGAGSSDPSHPLTLINNAAPTLNLPPFQLDACDVNFDQTCDINDLNGILALGPIALGVPRTDATEIFDLIGDDVINMQDVDEWLDVAAEFNGLPARYRRGDANLDGAVNQQDVLLWFSNRFTQTLFWDDGNFDGNAIVDFRDLVIWRNNRTR